MIGDKQSNDPNQGNSTSGKGSAGARLDQFITGAKQFSNAASRKAKEMADAAAPKIKALGDAATEQAQRAFDQQRASGSASRRLLSFYQNGGKERKRMIWIAGGIVMAIVILPILFIPAMFRSGQSNDAVMATQNGDGGSDPANAVATATSKAKELLPKVKEMSGRYDAILRYRDKISRSYKQIDDKLTRCRLMYGWPGGEGDLFTNATDARAREILAGYATFDDVKAAISINKDLLTQSADPAALLRQADNPRPSFESDVKDLHRMLADAGDPDAVMADVEAATTILSEIKPEVLTILDEPFRVLKEPAAPQGLVSIQGETHLIDGTDYYVENRIVSIPAKYKPIYIRAVIGPNQAVVVGDFRFVKNANGTNGFGAEVNVEMYECDPAYSDQWLKVGALQRSQDLIDFGKKIDWERNKMELANDTAGKSPRAMHSVIEIYKKLFGEHCLD